MSDLPDAIGAAADVATGAIAANAVEPGTGTLDRDGHTQESRCLNCDAPLAGNYCRDCGQRGHVHRTLSAFFHDLLHGVLHFEGKFWRTLPKLIWRPGVLTREYIDGKRARYISPIALFLFVVFVTYALFSALGSDPTAADLSGDAEVLNEAAISSIDEQLPAAREQAEQAEAAGQTQLAEALNAAITELERRRDENPDAVTIDLGDALETGPAADVATGTENAPTSGSDDGSDDASVLMNGDDPFSKAVAKARENPQLLIYKLQTNAYKFSWLLIPLSAPFVWLLFAFKRKFRMYDHTIFVTYSIAFMIGLVGIASLLGYLGFGGAGVIVTLYAPFHMYRHVRGTYGTSRLGAIVRMLALSVYAWVAIALFVTILGVSISG